MITIQMLQGSSNDPWHSSLLRVVEKINYLEGPKKADKSFRRVLHKRRLACFNFCKIKEKLINTATRVHRYAQTNEYHRYIWPAAAYITEPTRITPTSAALIGVIFTKCPDRIVCSEVRHISISNHSFVFACRKLSISGTSRGHDVITYRNFLKFNRENCRNDVASQSWHQIYCSTNPNDVWLQWERFFISIVDKHSP